MHRMSPTPRGAEDPRSALSPRAVLAVLKRRKWLFLGVAFLVAAAFVAAALLIPPTYRSQALVEARPPDPAGVQEPMELQVGEEMARITEIVHRRTILEPIVRELDLFPNAERITERGLDAARERITVRAEGPRTFAIGFEDRDRQRVARVAARLTEALIQTTRAEQENRAEARADFIASQIPDLEAQLEAEKEALADYRRQHAHEGPEQVESTSKLLEGVQTRLQQISGEITESEARRTAIEREMTELERRGVPTESAPTQAETRLEEARRELDRLQNRYTDRHPEVIRAQAEVAELETEAANAPAAAAPRAEYSPVQLRYVQLGAELEAMRERLSRSRTERAALEERAAAYRGTLAVAPRHEATLDSMTQDYQTTRARYEKLLDRYHESQLAERLQRTSQGALFHLVEAPRVPSASAGPHRLRLLLMGLLAAVGLGLGAVLLVEQGDSTFREPEELEAALGLPVLATIPTDGNGRRGDSESRVALIDDPNGPLAEQYRILATKLLREQPDPGSAVILVTSPVGSEGKTTTAVNLALALAGMKEDEVLLVDTDLGRPAVHRFLDGPLDTGLAELLAQPDDDPRAHVRRLEGLDVLQAGPFAPELRTALASPRASRVFQRLRQSYRIVVVDSPPVLAVAEGLMLERLVDSVLLVVRANSTPRQAVRRAVESLGGTSRLIGAVLNGVHESVAPAYPYSYHQEPVRSVTAGRPGR